jgi:hypothetical protein
VHFSRVLVVLHLASVAEDKSTLRQMWFSSATSCLVDKIRTFTKLQRIRTGRKTMSLGSRAFFALTLLAGLSLPHSTLAQTGVAPAGKAPPKLVLFMVIDGFPQEQFVKYYDLYGDRGFKLSTSTRCCGERSCS